MKEVFSMQEDVFPRAQGCAPEEPAPGEEDWNEKVKGPL